MVEARATEKICPECRRKLPIGAFATDRSRPSGVSTYCRPCKSAHCRRSRQKQRPEEALGFGVVHSQDEVAQILGISRSMVQKIEAGALRKLRRSLARRWGAAADGEWTLEIGGAR